MSLLKVIPASPAKHRLAILVGLASRVGDKPLLGNVELAPETVKVGIAEVLGRVLRRHQNRIDTLARILQTLQLPCAQPGGVFFEACG